MVGHITYLNDESMLTKFGRNLQGKDRVGFDFSTDFQVESYLTTRGDKFIERFDPNSYLYITKAIDYFDLTKEGSLIDGLAAVKARVLVIGISSDWLYLRTNRRRSSPRCPPTMSRPLWRDPLQLRA